MLTPTQIEIFRRTGHLTVESVFTPSEMHSALEDVQLWSEQFLAAMDDEQRAWYLERAGQGAVVLRKLDQPVFHREVFRNLARHPNLVRIAEQLIGADLHVVFSQVFMKPPEIGGPKPIHQDNYYFGPDDPDATLTAWIALDDATVENGCLYYCDEHQHGIVPHQAPEGEPFNLQIPEETADQFRMAPAPVRQGGVSFHHGNTPHQSSANRSKNPRRAAAIHYLRNSARLTHPALSYDEKFRVEISP